MATDKYIAKQAEKTGNAVSQLGRKGIGFSTLPSLIKENVEVWSCRTRYSTQAEGSVYCVNHPSYGIVGGSGYPGALPIGPNLTEREDTLVYNSHGLFPEYFNNNRFFSDSSTGSWYEDSEQYYLGSSEIFQTDYIAKEDKIYTKIKPLITSRFDLNVHDLQLELNLNTNIIDTSDNGYLGSENNLIYVPGKLGQAVSFNGSDSRIDFDTLSGSDIKTFSCWFNPVEEQTGTGSLIPIVGTTGTSNFRGLFLNTNVSPNKIVGLTASSTDTYYTEYEIPLYNKWYHLGLSYSIGEYVFDSTTSYNYPFATGSVSGQLDLHVGDWSNIIHIYVFDGASWKSSIWSGSTFGWYPDIDIIQGSLFSAITNDTNPSIWYEDASDTSLASTNLYINSQNINTGSFYNSGIATGSNLSLGGSEDVGFLKGYVDEVRLFGDALTGSNIDTLYNLRTGNNASYDLDIKGIINGSEYDLTHRTQSTINNTSTDGLKIKVINSKSYPVIVDDITIKYGE